MRLARTRSRRALLAAASVLAALVLPASASALGLHIVNESGRPDNEVFVDITGATFELENPAFEHIENNKPVALSEIPGGNVAINKLDSGRVYISYGAPVHGNESLASPIRFDWAEMTVTPKPEDAANLTAVNQFGIGMKLTTLGAGGEELESVGSTYANTIFDALQQIPGGPQSTVRGANGEILRVLSPDNPGSVYPLLTEYVHSMAGQTITLHSAFFSEPFITSVYSGTFEADGSITLTGTEKVEVLPKKGEKNPEEAKEHAASPIHFDGQDLIEEIYTGAGTPNNLEGAVRRDILVGFSLGLWGGKYGNDALSFCTNPNTTFQGTWCPNGFNVPAFAAARATTEPFPTYEGFAGVIDQYTSIYATPYNDASKKVQVSLDQAKVKTLQLSILPDSPPTPSGPSNPGGGSGSGNPSTGPAPAAPRTSKPNNTQPLSQVTFKLPKKAKLVDGKLKVGRLLCGGACGKVVAILRPKKGKGVVAREAVTARAPKDLLVLKPTKFGKRLLAHKASVPAKLTVTVTQPGHRPAQKQTPLRVLR
jgi:hypothetical protein